ncbi:PIG-L deacetylase family protein [Gordonia lacunae]|uniref:PIG-L family deacetylase n=1 Tax=Gordonia lacunae TaxID=417102 RepID=A0A2C9ZJD9_9ACTN|nr:PIG-L deacetylase family protein [Gordonia lacunae]OUC80859.1 PIG-L family deacetylase [Gordonia lacunae]
MTSEGSSTHRFGTTPTAADGTPESEWQRWFAARGPWPDFEPDVRRLVVLAAHPDDEILGVGGTMAAAHRRGIEVVPLCLSDGSASHPGSPTLSPTELAVRRHAEVDTATSTLGLGPTRWCGLGDGTLSAHDSEIEAIVDAVIAEKPDLPTALLAVWARDGHPDHEAVGRCARRVGDRHGVPVWMYPIWMWHWAKPDDPDIPWNRLRNLALADDVAVAKRAAVQAFETQIRPLSPAPEDAAVLGPHILDRLLRDREFVFV